MESGLEARLRFIGVERLIPFLAGYRDVIGNKYRLASPGGKRAVPCTWTGKVLAHEPMRVLAGALPFRPVRGDC